MNKVVGIGIAIIIIGAIIGVAYSMSSSNTSDDNLPVVEEIILEESISVEEEIVSEEIILEESISLEEEIVSEEIILEESISVEEEIVSEEPEQTGTDHTVELEESMGFKSP